jgi:hypothetical protein
VADLLLELFERQAVRRVQVADEVVQTHCQEQGDQQDYVEQNELEIKRVSHAQHRQFIQRAVETQLGLVYLPTAAVAEFYFPRFQLRSFTPHFHCEFVLVSLLPVRRNLLWVKLYVFFHNRVFEIQYFLVKIRKFFFKFKLFK